MALINMRCETEDHFAQAGLFLLQHRRALHPAFTTMDVVELLYGYVTQGHLYQTVDEEGRVAGVSAFYIGTPEQAFEDKEIAFVDIGVFAPEHRGTRAFVRGLRFLVDDIARMPGVSELRLAALGENAYVNRLYAKFTESSYEREGPIGPERVFCVKVNKIKAMLNKYDPV